MSYVFKLGGAAVALFLVGVLGIVLFSAIWIRIGLGMALVVFVGGLVFMAWRADKKSREARAGLERI